MMRSTLTILLTVLSFLTTCSSSDSNSSNELESTNVQYLGFFERESQHVAERDVRAKLSPSDSLLLSSELGIYRASRLHVEGEKLYIVDGSQLHIAVLDPENMEEQNVIQISEGEGPGELTQITGFDVEGDQIMLWSPDLQRLQYRDLTGELVTETSIESYPKSLGLTPEGNMIGLVSPVRANSDDAIHIVSSEGELVRSFATLVDGRNMLTDLKIHGYVSMGGNNQLFYAGYAEHLLKSWDLDGNLLFSVETIEPAPDGINYHTFEGAETRGAGFSEHGMFSASALVSTEDELVIVHAGMSSFSAPDQPQYLDFYDVKSGIYSHTLELPHRTSRIAIHENTLFALHMVEDEIYLFRYTINQ